MDSPLPAPRVAVLGPVLAEGPTGALREPSGTLGKSLIVALVLARGPVSVPSLVEELWNDEPPRQERAALQTLVSRLRTVSGHGILVSTPGGYALGVDPAATDIGLARMQRDRARAAERSGDHALARDAAEQALALWRGEPGDDLGSGPLAEELARTAAALRNELVLIRSRALRRTGDPAAALAGLDALAAAAPLDEQVQLERMRALDAAGRRTDALRLFAEVRERVRDSLGIGPGPELVAVNAELLTSEDASEDASERVPDGGSGQLANPRRIGLRTPPNDLLGRDDDLDALEHLIAADRLTTILGPGGLGKTRLAQEVGRRAVRIPAVVVVELAGVRTGADMTLALASTLGIRETSTVRSGEPGARLDLRSRILGTLAERETLLIVDNCEHIVDAAAAWVADILDATTALRVLATSRAPLAIAGEHVYALQPLASRAPDTADDAGHGPAVELFLERARAARPGVVLPIDTVARLCERLDGLPLAIELAAARVRSLSVDEIERRLGNRFALLTSGERNAPERHRTLLAVIDWSWNLLAPAERTLLRRLSRFPDGFGTEAAEALAGEGGGPTPASDVLDDLEALVNQSLVTVREDGESGILRYRMLETVREFGDRALAEAGERGLVHARMAGWAVRFSRDALGRMHGAEQVPTFLRVTAEQDNLVAILRDAIEERDGATVAAVFATLGYYWSLRSAHSEVIAFGPAAVDAMSGWEPSGDDERRDAVAVYSIIGATFLYAGIRTGLRAIGRLKRVDRDDLQLDSRLRAMAEVVAESGRMGPSMTHIERFRRSVDPELAAMGELLSAQLAENAGDLEGAMQAAAMAAEKARAAGDTWTMSSAAQALAQVQSQLAHPVEALQWAAEAQEGFGRLQAAGDLRQLDWIVAVSSIAVGDVDRARGLLERYLRQERPTELGDLDYLGIGHGGLAEIALVEGDDAEALRRFDQAVGVFGGGGTPTDPWLTMLGAASLLARQRIAERDPALVTRDAIDTLAGDLRRMVLVVARIRPAYIDRPVLGAGVRGIAGWALSARNERSARPGWTDAALELFAVAARMNGRQDLPSLRQEPLAAEIAAVHGEAAVRDALQAATRLERDAATARALELLRVIRP